MSHIAPVSSNSLSLKDAIHMYRREMELRKMALTSQMRYARELDRFAEHLGGGSQPIQAVGPNECKSFFATFAHCEPSTVNLEMTILASFFDYLVLDDVIPVSPMTKVRRVKSVPMVNRKRTRNSRQEIVKMLAEADAHGSWAERLCLYTLALLGPRRTALANARWGDVDGRNWTIAFREKGGKLQVKPVPKALRKLYMEYWAEHPDLTPEDWLIPNRDPNRVSLDKRDSRVIWYLVKNVSGRCDPPIETHVHSWRAAFATKCFDDGIDLKTVSALMGHSNIAITDASYLSEWDRERGMRQVEDLSFEVVSA